MGVILWTVLAVILIIIEILTLGLTTIWFAGGALIALILGALGFNFYIQFIGFLVVSLFLLIQTRPIAQKYFNKNRTKTNSESLIGKEVLITEDIDNLKNTGKAIVNGLEWTARTTDSNIKIQKGEVVTVLRIEGVKLIVDQRKEEPPIKVPSNTYEKSLEETKEKDKN